MESPELMDEVFKDLFSSSGLKTQSTDQLCVLDIWGHLHNIETGANVYGPTTTALHIAARYDMTHYVSWRIARNRDYRNVTKSGQSILHWAAFYGSEGVTHIVLVKALREEFEAWKGQAARRDNRVPADGEDFILDMLMHIRDTKASTALHLASAQGHTNVVVMLVKTCWELPEFKLMREQLLMGPVDRWKLYSQLLVSQEDYINYPDCDGNTALHLAVSYGHLLVVQVLLEWGADWRARNHTGETALQITMRMARDYPELKQVFKAIAKLLNDKAYAALDLAKSPNPEARTVDKMFDGIRLRLTETSSSIPKPIQLSVHGIVSGLLNARRIDSSDGRLTWIHLPANNVRHIIPLLG